MPYPNVMRNLSGSENYERTTTFYIVGYAQDTRARCNKIRLAECHIALAKDGRGYISLR